MRKRHFLKLLILSVTLLAPTRPVFSQALIEAAKRHDLEKVKVILSSPVDVNQKGPGGATALLVAVRSWDAPICKELLDHGADPNARSDSAMTPLMEASLHGSFEIVEYLLKKGADANLCARIVEGPDGTRPNNPRLVFSQNSTRIEGVEKSPLILAAEGANLSVARLLLEHGADVNKQAEWFITTPDAHYSARGRTALMCAVQNRFPGLVRLLLEKKADVTVQERATALSWNSNGPERYADGDAAEQPLFVRHSTALHIATERCDRESAQLLLAAGADAEGKDGMDLTPLITAIKNGCTPVAEMLIERGANVNARKNTPWSPLVLAAERGKLRLVELLIKAGASVDQKAGEKELPLLSWAVLGGNRQVVRTLLERGANVNATTSDNFTPLMIAASEGEASIVRFLVSWKAKVNARNNEGQTALIIASKKGHGDCVQALLLGGADPGIRDNRGKTALANAMEQADQKTVKLLLEGGTSSAGTQWVESERLSDVMEYLSTELNEHYYSESQYLAFAKPYGKWDVRPLHVASLPHPEGDGIIAPAEVAEFVWEVVAHNDFNLPISTAQKFRDEFIKEGFAHKERYCKNFYPSRRAAFLALCMQAEHNTRSIYVQQRDLVGGAAYERVDNIYRQNKTYWKYLLPPGSPFQMSPRIDTLRGYKYTSVDESILQGLFGTGCYCMVKVNGCIVFLTGGVLDCSIGFIYSKTRPGRKSLGPLFNLALLEDLGDGFFFYVSR